MALNPKQRMFVREYVKDKNATRAAIAVGYSKKTAKQMGSENLSKPAIAHAIEKRLAEIAEKVDISAERTLSRLAEIAYQKLSKQELKTKSSNTLKALEMLSKHFKLLTDVHELGGKDGAPLVVLTMPANGSEKKPDEPKNE